MNSLLRSIQKKFGSKKRSRTIRYTYSTLFSVAALLGAAVITADDVSYVRLEATDTTIEAGELFAIDVYAFAHVPVNAVDITLKFDPDAVDVTGVDKGQSVITIWAQEPIIEDSQVILRGGTFKKGFLKEHKVATVNLRAKETGSSYIKASEVVLLAGDGEGSSVATSESFDSNINLYIYDENTDPDSIAIDVDISVVTDISGDGKVTIRDVSMFMSAWSTKNKIFDFNNDGRMTFRDFSIILADLVLK